VVAVVVVVGVVVVVAVAVAVGVVVAVGVAVAVGVGVVVVVGVGVVVVVLLKNCPSTGHNRATTPEVRIQRLQGLALTARTGNAKWGRGGGGA
jgi:hypothetical protein